MSETDYLFFAPIANARGHFRSVVLEPPFRIERWSHDKIVRLWRQLAWMPKFQIEVQVEHSHVVPHGYSVGHVVVGQARLPTAREEKHWLLTHKRMDDLTKTVEDRVRLAGLHLCGQVELAAQYWYTIAGKKPELEYGGILMSPVKELPATVGPQDIVRLNSFLRAARLPLTPEYVQLAFEHWEESARSESQHIEFLSLMMALEALFNVGAQDIRYRVSRSVAVLLGDDPEDSEHIFESIRHAYDVRSKLVHTGKAKGIEKVWFWQLRRIVRDAIVRLMTLNLPKEEVSNQVTRLGFGEGARVTANPSLERTSTGKALGTRGAQGQHAPRGPSPLPAEPAQLKR